MTFLKQTNPDYAAFILRISLGTIWIAHGSYKLVVFGAAGFADWMTSLGLPGFMAWPIILMELIGGIALILGVYGRYVSIVNMPILLGALYVHSENGWVFTSEGGGWEFPLFLIMIAIAHILSGDGKFQMNAHFNDRNLCQK
tara:strand:+ start:1499 stop:1924 length:426 start_codon:yes stop_codon:yes gene_type:complete